MIIDGSYGEGGGQILRTAVALSCILGEDVRVINIRKGRTKPGLKNQHIHGIKLAAEMCGAGVDGLELGSTELSFSPSRIKGGNYSVCIKTAGSITLVLQVALPIALASGERVRIDVTGGTDVPFSPPVDYYAHVLFPLLSRFGARINARVIERGYYSKGGGRVIVEIEPRPLAHISLLSRGKMIKHIAYVNQRALPEHVLRRIENALGNFDIIEDTKTGSISTGCGVVLVAEYENTLLSGTALCRKGIRAERVAEMAKTALLEETRSSGTVDRHMADHLPIFAFVAGAVEYKPSVLTSHAITNLWLVEKFGAKVEKGDKISVQAYI